jgi:SAM-dependent methyltransferase
MSEAHDIVRRGYDAIADRFAEWSASFESPVAQWVEKLVELLPPDAKVLELGCGGDNASTRLLASRFHYFGVDISDAQVERARRANPHTPFLRADATELELEDEQFDAVVSLFMLGHVRRDAQEALLRKVARWLVPGGLFLATMGTADARDEIDDDWLGAPMFFSSFSADENRELLRRAGFDMIDARVIPNEEPGHGLVSFMWVLARRLP